VFTSSGPQIMPGGDPSAPSLGWLTLPPGFCAHYYGTVPVARQLRFAPDGRLFVASPSAGTTGGGGNGLAAIMVLPDADQNGQADSTMAYLTGLPKTQGLLFTGGYLYFQGDPSGQGQNGYSVMRVPFKNGDVSPTSSIETVTTITAPQSAGHWPKVMDVAQDGTIYVTNGGDQSDECVSTNPVRGAIFKIQPDGTSSEVAQGFRNPIALRCEGPARPREAGACTPGRRLGLSVLRHGEPVLHGHDIRGHGRNTRLLGCVPGSRRVRDR
jgi:hypothetical protein